MVRFGSRCLSDGNRRGAPAPFAATLWLRLGLAVIVSLAGSSTAHLVATSLFNLPEHGGPLAYTDAGVVAGAPESWQQFSIQTQQRFVTRSSWVS